MFCACISRQDIDICVRLSVAHLPLCTSRSISVSGPDASLKSDTRYWDLQVLVFLHQFSLAKTIMRLREA